MAQAKQRAASREAARASEMKRRGTVWGVWFEEMAALPFTYDATQDLAEYGTFYSNRALLDLEWLIGNYSEAFLACGYNDDEVLDLLLSGRMNAEAKYHCTDKSAFLGKHWFEGQMGSFLRQDFSYAEQLQTAIERAGGVWPHASREPGAYWLVEKVGALAERLGLVGRKGGAQ